MANVTPIRNDTTVVRTGDTYATGSADYDWQVAGMSFVAAVTDQNPHERAFARVNKEMVDNSPQPGDQSLDGWWIRSMTDWRGGAGYRYMEPITADPIARTYDFSYGVNIWNEGQLSLHLRPYRNGEVPAATVTPSLAVWNGDVYVASGSKVYRIPGSSFLTPGTAVTPTQYCTVSGNITKLLVAEGVLIAFTDSAGAWLVVSGQGRQLFTCAKSGRLDGWYVKDRLLIAGANDLYVTSIPTDTSKPTVLSDAIVTAKDTSWLWLSATATSGRILLAGSGSGYSSISALSPSTDGSLPKLEAPVVVAEFPRGETLAHIYSYLGVYTLIATDRGVRLGLDQGGEFTYGPLLGCPTVGPFHAFDKYAWAPTNDAGEGRSGLMRFDFSQVTGEQKLAWASDVRVTGTGLVQAAAVVNGSSQVLLTIEGSTVGIWSVMNGSDTEEYGVLQSGQIRMGSTVPKNWARFNLNGAKDMDGAVKAELVTPDGVHEIGVLSAPLSEVEWSFSELGLTSTYAAVRLTLARVEFPDIKPGPAPDPWPPAPDPWPPPTPWRPPVEGEQSFNSLRVLTFGDVKNTYAQYRDIAKILLGLTSTTTPVVEDWGLRSVPAIPRTEMVRIGLLCFDFERTASGMILGAEGSAMKRYKELASRLGLNTAIKMTDLNSGTSDMVVVDEMSYRQTAAPSRASGFGGVIDIVARVV